MIGREQLRYFVTVADEGQITRAAEKLYMAQPGLSQSIAKLESDLGLTLFERHHRGVSLTSAGLAFYEKAAAAVAAEDELTLLAAALAQGAIGTLIFGTVGLPPWQSNPALYEGFTEENPAVEIQLKKLPFPSPDTKRWLAEVDVAIASPISPDPAIWSIPVRSEPPVALVGRSHRLHDRSTLTVSELLDETFVRRSPLIDSHWSGIWSLDRERGGPPVNLTESPGSTVETTIGAVASGQAVAVAPEMQAAPISQSLPGIAAIPIADALAIELSLIGRLDRVSEHVEALRAVARRVGVVRVERFVA